MARTAEVKRDARIGEAEARADSQIKEAIAEEERLAARLVNDIEIAKAQRDFELKKAAYDQEVQAKVRVVLWERVNNLIFIYFIRQSRNFRFARRFYGWELSLFLVEIVFKFFLLLLLK